MKLYYLLKHKDKNIAIIMFKDKNEFASEFKTLEPEYLPYMREMDVSEFNLWWRYRGIPNSRPKLNEILRQENVETATLLLRKNLGLNLNDCYWLCPAELDLKWQDVNLFHETEKVLLRTFTGENENKYMPRATSNGNMEQYAQYDNGWKLHKYSRDNGQQSINEKFAEAVHRTQGFSNFVEYELYPNDSGVYNHTVCSYFTNEMMEYIPAFEVLEATKKDNSESEYERYIRACGEHGLDCKELRDFMDYMVLYDFIITNQDRHYRNFGILRDSSTLEFKGVAPIFDNGNSMFYNSSGILSRRNVLELEITSFYNKEEKMLKVVKNKKAIERDALPSPSEVRDFYEQYNIDNYRASVICKNYAHKIEFLKEFQQGKKISLYYEKEEEKKAKANNSVKKNDKQSEELSLKQYSDLLLSGANLASVTNQQGELGNSFSEEEEKSDQLESLSEISRGNDE